MPKEKPKRSGAFTAEENQVLRSAIDTICAIRDISPVDLVDAGDLRKDTNKKIRGIWQEIAHYLPDRSQSSVYRRAIRVINPYKTGPWEREELQQLHVLVAQHGSKWTRIQAELNRSAESIADKWREIRQQQALGGEAVGTKKRLTWNDDETEQLRRLLLHELGMEDNVTTFLEIYNKVEAEGIKVPFTAISRQLGGDRTRLNCYERYLLMAGKKRKTKKQQDEQHLEANKRQRIEAAPAPAPVHVPEEVTFQMQEATAEVHEAVDQALEAAAVAAAAAVASESHFEAV
mmetsp:Transcript_18018/g.51601  ORF Transcript_18018/g.51601 Transcript_18018/m.51601 type:complete len:289 (-) Transcript_18018:181-1047(-)|eukprot:CAMPEP_0181052722 /NCGR_PEP_ID=MMETSP1070-20121207/17739_1 /TAXON_ID=265543 /ORGANISM="Minutocellus polymorphus, Strain NH13" /LENGTH=288 /DNA_ID=CAMNT_0023131829 /DNA_START=219 /DNA_END=1085 /DNA_ORIENTATION=-